jgi:hypothetical protein
MKVNQPAQCNLFGTSGTTSGILGLAQVTLFFLSFVSSCDGGTLASGMNNAFEFYLQ